MPSYYRSKKKNARAMIEKRIALIAAVAVLLVVMIVLLSRCSRGKDVTTANAPVPTPEPSAVAANQCFDPRADTRAHADACPDAACRHSVCVYRVDGSRSRGARDYPVRLRTRAGFRSSKRRKRTRKLSRLRLMTVFRSTI